MKAIFSTLFLLLLTAIVYAGDTTQVDSGHKKMKLGVGDFTDIAYSFAKGDKIILHANSSKRLDRTVFLLYPRIELATVKSVKIVDHELIMPEDGILVIRFISDRNGTTALDYTVSRIPASDEVKDYDTRILWRRPSNGIGFLTPERVAK
jgi:hypothetical protein